MTLDEALPESAQEKQEPFAHFRSFVDEPLAAAIVKQVLALHTQQHECGNHSIPWEHISKSSTSFKLDLGIPCGGDLSKELPLAACTLRKAFEKASKRFGNPTLKALARDDSRLTGLALLYGTHASMPSHYDSPTQPGQRNEWLAMLSLGSPCQFQCNDTVLTLYSGDVVVMDSMAVLHGVQGIGNEPLNCHAALGLPILCRLGVLFWQAQEESVSSNLQGLQEVKVVELGGLFGDDSDSEENDD